MQACAAGKLVRTRHPWTGQHISPNSPLQRATADIMQVLLYNRTGNICMTSAKLAHLDARHGILLAYDVTQDPLQSHSAPSVVNIKGLQVFSSSQCPAKPAFSCVYSHAAAFVSCVPLSSPTIYSQTVGTITLNIPRQYLQTVTSPQHAVTDGMARPHAMQKILLCIRSVCKFCAWTPFPHGKLHGLSSGAQVIKRRGSSSPSVCTEKSTQRLQTLCCRGGKAILPSTVCHHNAVYGCAGLV